MKGRRTNLRNANRVKDVQGVVVRGTVKGNRRSIGRGQVINRRDIKRVDILMVGSRRVRSRTVREMGNHVASTVVVVRDKNRRVRSRRHNIIYV